MSIIYINPYQFAAVGAYDPDAQSYITAVEAADGQALEVGVKDAINAFVVGCKSDGIWAAIKACCIMAGARTLNGALVPLVGAAPTNFNFAAGDYNRKTGLLGDGSTKYLDSNRNNNADPQDSKHVSIFVSTLGTTAFGRYFAAGNSLAGDTSITLGSPAYIFINNTSFDQAALAAGFAGLNRSASASYSYRNNSATQTFSRNSTTPRNENIGLFANVSASLGYQASQGHLNCRLAFYSIGESLDLALLDTRVTALVNAIGAAIP